MLLGLNPRDKKTLTTLRLIPTVRDTFAKAGIKMQNFDALPNYWNTPAHNIRKRTDRTRSCDVCHVERKGFLTKELLIKNGSRANESLIVIPKPINR
jgi:rubredoxin